MRKIGSESQLEEKRKRNMVYISIFMLGVLVFGTVGYAFSSYLGTTGNNDENQEIVPEGKFSVEFEGQKIYLSHSLEEVQNIPVETNIDLNTYVGNSIYYSAEEVGALTDAFQFFSKYTNKIKEGCYGSCEEDLPEKDCSENLLIFKESENNKVYQEENCVFIEGDEKAVDAFLYKLMGLK